jgi:hypothetical protein
MSDGVTCPHCGSEMNLSGLQAEVLRQWAGDPCRGFLLSTRDETVRRLEAAIRRPADAVKEPAR